MKAGNYHSVDCRVGRDASPERPLFIAEWKTKFPQLPIPQFAVINPDGSCRHWNEWPDGKDRRLPPGTFNID